MILGLVEGGPFSEINRNPVKSLIAEQWTRGPARKRRKIGSGIHKERYVKEPTGAGEPRPIEIGILALPQATASPVFGMPVSYTHLTLPTNREV